MQIHSISVSASRAFPSPTNHRELLKFTLNLNAELHATDDPNVAVVMLQGQAEALAEKHKQRLIDDAFDKPLTDLDIKALPTEAFFGAKPEPQEPAKPKIFCHRCGTVSGPFTMQANDALFCSRCDKVAK